MKAGNIKGALLEYVVRKILSNCGFSNVRADNLYLFERGGLFYINGKGAAHDADILMNPPFQMPFVYPTQLLFECKSYKSIVNLTIIRNALGLRNDINDFEIVTKESLANRQNNRRDSYAIDLRTRFLYQVGVATLNDFTKPAVEFAVNNKIPLLSLSWILRPDVIDKFNNITQLQIDSFNSQDIQNVYNFLKDREGNLNNSNYSRANDFLNSFNIFSDIIKAVNEAIRYSYIGLLETGDMVFLVARSRSKENILNQDNSSDSLNATIHWNYDRANFWKLSVYSKQNNTQSDFDFYLPKQIYNQWKKFNLDKLEALKLKENFLSKVTVFNHKNNPDSPISIINIDNDWLKKSLQKLSEGNE
jgi:hypothetical protein